MISKEQLVFDTTDAASIAASDKVGSHTLSGSGELIGSETINSVERLSVDSTLKDGAGTALTSTLVGGKQGLDVNVIEGINVEVDLDAADDSVASHLFDGTGNAISSTGGALHISDAGGSITVDATDLDIRDLTAASDSVQAWAYDGAGTALTSTLVGSDQALDVNIVQASDEALANTAIATAANTLASADTAQDVVSSPLANRKYLMVRNQSNKRIFVGASGVTAANGFPLSPGSVMELRVGAAVDVEFVGSSGDTPEIRTMELS
jgi:hypothetical protein